MLYLNVQKHWMTSKRVDILALGIVLEETAMGLGVVAPTRGPTTNRQRCVYDTATSQGCWVVRNHWSL
jgi:hypothetical protein